MMKVLSLQQDGQVMKIDSPYSCEVHIGSQVFDLCEYQGTLRIRLSATRMVVYPETANVIRVGKEE